jgi:hypothetical protein
LIGGARLTGDEAALSGSPRCEKAFAFELLERGVDGLAVDAELAFETEDAGHDAMQAAAAQLSAEMGGDLLGGGSELEF